MARANGTGSGKHRQQQGEVTDAVVGRQRALDGECPHGDKVPANCEKCNPIFKAES